MRRAAEFNLAAHFASTRQIRTRLWMGAWGYGVRQDDLVCDVVADFEDALKKGKCTREATRAVREQFQEVLSESCDQAALVWVGLADAQWTYGHFDPAVLKRVKEDLASGASLAMWDDEPSGDRSRRRKVLEQFIAKIEVPNPRPKKAPKVVIRPPKFRPGDCLTYPLSNGQYGAALILAVDHSEPEYGKDLVAVLDYMSPKKPTLEVFRGRKWLCQTHHEWRGQPAITWHWPFGFRTMKNRIETVGTIEIVDTDPNPGSCHSYQGWKNLGEEVVWQKEWDAAHSR